jgi:hypothetical protein
VFAVGLDQGADRLGDDRVDGRQLLNGGLPAGSSARSGQVVRALLAILVR